MSTEQRYLEVVKKADILGMVIEVYGNIDKPLFLAKDIANRIGYRRDSVNKMLEMVDFEDEKLNGKIFRSGQNRNMWFLTEEGVYSILMKCGTDEGKRFRNGFKLFLKAWRKGEVKVVEKTMSVEEMIISQAQSVIELKNRFEVLEDKVNNQITIDSGKQNKLHMTIKKRVYERFDSLIKGYLFYERTNDKTCTFDKKLKKSLFSAIHRELKNKFGVPSYRDIKEQDFESAITFAENWREDQIVRDKIHEL